MMIDEFHLLSGDFLRNTNGLLIAINGYMAIKFRVLTSISFLLTPNSYLLSPISYLLSPISYLLSPVFYPFTP